jgi:hypothetical protein
MPWTLGKSAFFEIAHQRLASLMSLMRGSTSSTRSRASWRGSRFAVPGPSWA